MANINWPTANQFPQVPQKGFQETVQVGIIRSPMDMGPAKVRRRNARVSTMNLSFILTTLQTQTLETFIKSDIRGVARFNFPHPRLLGTTVEARIIPQGEGEFYTLTYLAPGYWSASLTFEILP
jgi:hypothetical protein